VELLRVLLPKITFPKKRKTNKTRKVMAP